MSKDTYSILCQIMKILEIEVVEVPFSGISKEMIGGFYANYKDKDLIVIEQTDTQEEKAYTLSHELGHYFLHKKELTDYRSRRRYWTDSKYRNRKELEANRFARKILALIEKEYRPKKSRKLITRKIDRFLCFMWSILVVLYKTTFRTMSRSAKEQHANIGRRLNPVHSQHSS